MKGFIQTSDYLRAILNKEQGIRGADLLSHISFFEIPAYHKVLAVSDVALIVKPTFDEKVSMIKMESICFIISIFQIQKLQSLHQLKQLIQICPHVWMLQC